MQVIKELVDSVAKMCETCGGYQDMPNRCDECKAKMRLHNEDIVVMPRTLKILSVTDMSKKEGGD